MFNHGAGIDFVTAFNAVEAAWWIAVGIALIGVRVTPDTVRIRWLLAAAFTLFGISDLVEVWSGAWWRPWWLAVWKILCGTIITVVALLWFRRSRRRADPAP